MNDYSDLRYVLGRPLEDELDKAIFNYLNRDAPPGIIEYNPERENEHDPSLIITFYEPLDHETEELIRKCPGVRYFYKSVNEQPTSPELQ